jgi:hypothetical protein
VNAIQMNGARLKFGESYKHQNANELRITLPKDIRQARVAVSPEMNKNDVRDLR